MMRLAAFITIMGAAGLAGCEPITPAPDYAIKVMPSPDGQGYVALPPACPRWSDNNVHFFDNQPLPQFGCADARNLAMMVEKPEDLLRGRDMGPASGVLTSGSIMRYNNNQTRGLIWFTPTPQNSVDATSAPTATSAMTGETPLNSGGSSSPLGK